MRPTSWTMHVVLVVAAAVAVGLAALGSAAASTWTVSGNGSSTAGGFDFADVRVQLGDPIGSANAATAGGIPLTIRRTATTFSVSGSFSFFDGECTDSGSFAGSAPLVGSGSSATASAAITGSGIEDCGAGAAPFTISGTFAAQSLDGGSGASVVATVSSISGTVAARTVFGAQAIAPGTPLTAGTLLETGGNGNVTFTLDGGVQVSATPNSQVTLLPRSGTEVAVSQIGGLLSHSRPPGAASTPYRVDTATVKVRPTGTEFTTRYAQTGTLGSTVVSVQSGLVEVENRRGQRTTLVAGQTAAFDDAVPRVVLILPVHEGTVRDGTVNTFSWTAFPGAAGYLFEYTLNPTGFTVPNPAGVEDARSAFRIFPPSIIQSGQTVEFPLRIPLGLAPKGTRAQWRIFPIDAAGQILVGSTGSDGSTETIE